MASNFTLYGGLFLGLLTALACGQSTVDVWLTTGDESKKLSLESPISGSAQPVGGLTVGIDRTQTGQTMKGFGAALSNSASSLIYNSPQKNTILESLFDATTGAGVSYVRLVMGGSDFNAVDPYTYDDLPAGNTDFNMDLFSIDKDRDFVLPLVKEIVAQYPDVKIIASPWSPPAWMKNPPSLDGGSLKSGSEYLASLAEYFVSFIQAYQLEGVSIDAVTLQNEPEHADNGYPTMSMPWDTQRDLIRDHVGPRFQAEGITADILILDHNWDLTWYVENILNDAAAAQYIAGSAWHCYAGDSNSPASIKSQYPDKDLYFTECSGGDWDTNFGSSLGWNIQTLFIGQTRIGARSVLLWNLALDEFHGPRVGVSSGCTDCRGVLTVHTDGTTVDQNVEYYTIAHFGKFARPDSVLIGSQTYPSNSLETAAYLNTDGSVVVVILNTSWDNSVTFQVELDGQYYYYENLPTRSVVTFVTN